MDETKPQIVSFKPDFEVTLKIPFVPGKQFPLMIITDKKKVEFEFLVYFTDGDSFSSSPDYYGRGDHIKIPRPGYSDADMSSVISVSMKCDEQLRASVSCGYSSILREKKFNKASLFSKETREHLNKLYKEYKPRVLGRLLLVQIDSVAGVVRHRGVKAHPSIFRGQERPSQPTRTEQAVRMPGGPLLLSRSPCSIKLRFKRLLLCEMASI